MRKAELIAEIVEYLRNINDTIERVKEYRHIQHTVRVPDNIEDATVPMIREGHHWLKEISEVANRCRRVWYYTTPDRWIRYKEMDLDQREFREIKALNTNLKELSSKIRGKRPVIFHKKKFYEATK